MNRSALIAVSLVALSPLALAAQDKKVDRATLSPAVQKAIDDNTKGATSINIVATHEGAQKVYEAETIVNGHTRDVQISLAGKVNEIEEEIAFDTLPDAVKKGLTAKAGTAKITKVVTLTKHEKLVAYEAATLKGTKKGEVQVGPNGETLKHAE